MPIGLQLVGRPWAEAMLCTAGDAFQRATDWHLRKP
jgi:aspartyl-tRNA(Asn)/glutamyl-tRNA(Gln) amidotransferase subunit A